MVYFLPFYIIEDHILFPNWVCKSSVAILPAYKFRKISGVFHPKIACNFNVFDEIG